MRAETALAPFDIYNEEYEEVGTMGDSFATGYALGQDSNNGCYGGYGGYGMGGEWIWIILLIALLGGGLGFGGGWGGGFGGGWGGMALQGMATRADINEGFALQNITSGIQGIQQGICDSTYALNNAITGGFNNSNMGVMQGFNGVQRDMCELSHQLNDCCCENRQAIAQVRYDMATQACDTRNLIQTTTRDIIDGQNANTRAILDFLTQDKISSLQAENQALKFSASQDRQNALLTTAMTAQTSQIIGAINPPAVPSYQVPNPYTGRWGSYGHGGYNNGCGCGCAA